jgi:hypothetical protein
VRRVLGASKRGCRRWSTGPNFSDFPTQYKKGAPLE